MSQRTWFLLGLTVLLPVFTPAGEVTKKATVKEYEQVFTTYPYSDPDPIPTMSRFYPYFRYDGYTDKPVQKKWKVVELANDYLRVLILPEIGGKIWAAIERSTGKSFIYYNHVVKFRDISMRGPWTSGGIEANYGIMGHTPACFAPVDYKVWSRNDGSVSCLIGVLDLLTRTNWLLEVRLPADGAYFQTRSFWHNSSGQDQPYYTWMNAAIKSAGNLQFINPGTHYLGHDGQAHDWPINKENGRDLSWYENNNFGSYKSYHVMGRFSEFFGGYWHNEDFGMAHCSNYADKPGRKIWIWGLSREGMIWDKLLTDNDGQYVEVQSGRLFNQGDEQSGRTPFKHKEFPPYATDTWTEYWFPVKGIKGFVSASPWGAMNVAREPGRLVIRICPVRPLTDKLEIYDGDILLHTRGVTLKPMQPVEEIFDLVVKPVALRIVLGGGKLQYVPEKEEITNRTRFSPADFNWDSVYGLYLKGKESARMRDYGQAEVALQACLNKDPHFPPALVELAALANRRANPTLARSRAQKALSIDTYDPAANYHFGLASVALKRPADAKEAFSIASLSPAWRSAAYTELAKHFLREKRYDRALSFAMESSNCNFQNMEAMKIAVVALRLEGFPDREKERERPIREEWFWEIMISEGLRPFGLFEEFLGGEFKREDMEALRGLITNELPHENYLEIASWYRGIGRGDDAAKVLELAPPTAEVLYWLAFLRRKTGLLARAEGASPAFVFPFRHESIPVFEWAIAQSRAWQPRYYLALVCWHLGEPGKARELLASCGDEPRFGPFYAARAQLNEEDAPRDLRRGAQLDPGQWRYGAMLAKHFLKRGETAAAREVAAEYCRRFPANTVLALLHAKTLVLTKQYQEAANLLNSLNVLPCEGSTEARALYHQANMWLAVQQMKAGRFEEALPLLVTAREWPERLGAGKPYPEDVDERLIDWLTYQCYLKRQGTKETQKMLDKILAFQPRSKRPGAGTIIRSLALKANGRAGEGEKLLQTWLMHEPANPMVKWGIEVFAGRPVALPANLHDEECRLLADAPVGGTP